MMDSKDTGQLHRYAALLFSFPSLFFSPEEIVPPQIPPKPLILSAILYTDPTHWAVWINDCIIRPETTRDDFQIEDVTPTTVMVSRPYSGEESPEMVTLYLQKEDASP